MSEPLAVARLINRLLAIEMRSFMRHLDESKPYLDLSSVQAWERIKALSHTSIEHGEKLVAMLKELDQEPEAASFNSNVAGMHYLRLDAILPTLIDEEKQQIAAYRLAISACAGTPQAKQLSTMLDENVHQLHELDSIHASLASHAGK